MKKLPDRELLCYSYIAFRPWNHWNARRAILYCLLAGDTISVLLFPGTCEAPLERPKGIFLVLNARCVRVIDRVVQSATFFAFECLSCDQIAYINQIS